MLVIINWLEKQELKRLIVAVPLTPKDLYDKIKDEKRVDDVVVLQSPWAFLAIGTFYEDFSQVISK
jgi:predicted phosphoribosyltransferase